ncbi:MAG: winged helix-turn-helix transcriptional regulator [Thermomicrobiales bacterium]
MAKTKTYGHYCAAARSLELVGDKWSLLIVRDLLAGPQRFSDLKASLRAITPKLLTTRLRDLEAAGVLERDEEPGRREVWYHLTPAGLELRPVIRELLIWGAGYAEPPAPTDTVSARRAGVTFSAILNRRKIFPAEPALWELRFDTDTISFIRFDGIQWSPELIPETASDLAIEARADQWIAMLRADDLNRMEFLTAMKVSGSAGQALEFDELMSRSPTETPLA